VRVGPPSPEGRGTGFRIGLTQADRPDRQGTSKGLYLPQCPLARTPGDENQAPAKPVDTLAPRPRIRVRISAPPLRDPVLAGGIPCLSRAEDESHLLDSATCLATTRGMRNLVSRCPVLTGETERSGRGVIDEPMGVAPGYRAGLMAVNVVSLYVVPASARMVLAAAVSPIISGSRSWRQGKSHQEEGESQDQSLHVSPIKGRAWNI